MPIARLLLLFFAVFFMARIHGGPVLDRCTGHLLAQNSYYHNHILKEDGQYKVLWVDESENITLLKGLSLKDAHRIVSQIPKSRRLRFDKITQEASEHFLSLGNHLKQKAWKVGASVHIRTKSTESIRHKLFKKAARAKKEGTTYNLEELGDILGAQIIIENKRAYDHYFAHPMKLLETMGIPSDTVLNIMVKSTDSSQLNQALHFNIEWNGVKTELQLLTNLMYHWQMWNHEVIDVELVYPIEVNSLKLYSKEILEFIQAVENGELVLTSTQEIEEFDAHTLKKYGLDISYSFFSPKYEHLHYNWEKSILQSLNLYITPPRTATP